MTLGSATEAIRRVLAWPPDASYAAQYADARKGLNALLERLSESERKRYDAEREVERCWRELDEAKALLATAYDDFNGNGHPTNSWRKRVEDIGAWPKRTATS